MLFCVYRDAVSMRVYDFRAFQLSFSHQFRVLIRSKKCFAILVHQPRVPRLSAIYEQGIIEGVTEDLTVYVPFPSVCDSFVSFFARSGSDARY